MLLCHQTMSETLRDTTLRDVNFRQAVSHLPCPDPRGVHRREFLVHRVVSGAVLPTYTGHEDHGWQRMGLGWEGKEGRRNSLRSVLLQPSAPEAVALSCGSEADSCMWDPGRPEWCVGALGCPRVSHQVLFFKGPLGLFLTPLQGPAAQIQAITNPS